MQYDIRLPLSHSLIAYPYILHNAYVSRFCCSDVVSVSYTSTVKQSLRVEKTPNGSKSLNV